MCTTLNLSSKVAPKTTPLFSRYACAIVAKAPPDAEFKIIFSSLAIPT